MTLNLVTIDTLPFVFDSQLQKIKQEFPGYFISESAGDDTLLMLDEPLDDGCWSPDDMSSDKNEKYTYLEIKHVYDTIQNIRDNRDKSLLCLTEWTPTLPEQDPAIHTLAQDLLNALVPDINHHWHVSLSSDPNYSLEKAFENESDIYMSRIMGLHERMQKTFVYTCGKKRSFKIEKVLGKYIEDDWQSTQVIVDRLRKWLTTWISEYSTCPG
jgi:hypothetical protein